MATDYTLYGYDCTAATSIHWILHDLLPHGVTFTYVPVDFAKQEQKLPAYLSVNPKGKVPCLVVDGAPVSETGATAWLLAERHPEAHLAPGVTSRSRAKFVETFVYIVNALLPSLRDWFYASRDGDETYAHGMRTLALARVKDVYATLDAQLADGRTYLVPGDAPTIVDYIFSATTAWDGFLDTVSARYPNIKRHTDTMRAGQAWKDVCAAEPGIEASRPIKDWEKPFLDV